MSYRGVGEDTVAETSPENVGNRTPPYTRQALAIMGVTALPWLPVVTGAWVGNKALRKNGKLWGAPGGAVVSFLVIRNFTVKLGGSVS